MSKALLKPKTIEVTYGLCSRKSVTVWRSEIGAAVVEPVRQKVY